MPSTQPRRGLFLRHNTWWMYVRPPEGEVKQRSTGAKREQVQLANAIFDMIATMVNERRNPILLASAAAGEIKLLMLYNHTVAGTLHELRAERAAAAIVDPDIRPLVELWLKDLPETDQSADYRRMIRALILDDAVFLASAFTEATLQERLGELRHPSSGKPLANNSKRNYLTAWRQFYKFARRRAPLAPPRGVGAALPSDPFAYVDEWAPPPGPSRMEAWDHGVRIAVLERMTGPYREIMTLILGSGMELGAALAMTGADVGRDDSTRTVVAHGTKTDGRRDRTIFVDRWAWPVIAKRARSVLPYAPLWPGLDGNTLRDHLYRAQVAARLIPEPPEDKYGQPLWGRVKGHHTIHDSRHTYCLNRLLGLDGEPRQSLKYCAMQCGHADEQMVMKVYSRLNIAERLRMIELAEAREAGRREAK